ncbi:hypothetical protein NO371_22960 [Escherichia coli]|nr:hypothetical protein [Escherichia coli]
MNINTIYRHPAELEAEAMLSRKESYPDDFTLADRTAERTDPRPQWAGSRYDRFSQN